MTRSSRATLPLLLLGPVLLAGCANASKTFGLQVTPPNAYEVGTEAPLSMPPDLQSLPSPMPGEPRPQQVSASNEAQSVLSPQAALDNGNTTMGAGQQALLQQAGPTPPANIRATINHQAQLQSRSGGFIDSLMSFDGKKYPNEIVNAAGEQKRLQENAALGQPVTQGATPKTTPEKSKGILGDFFGLF